MRNFSATDGAEQPPARGTPPPQRTVPHNSGFRPIPRANPRASPDPPPLPPSTSTGRHPVARRPTDSLNTYPRSIRVVRRPAPDQPVSFVGMADLDAVTAVARPRETEALRGGVERLHGVPRPRHSRCEDHSVLGERQGRSGSPGSCRRRGLDRVSCRPTGAETRRAVPVAGPAPSRSSRSRPTSYDGKWWSASRSGSFPHRSADSASSARRTAPYRCNPGSV